MFQRWRSTFVLAICIVQILSCNLSNALNSQRNTFVSTKIKQHLPSNANADLVVRRALIIRGGSESDTEDGSEDGSEDESDDVSIASAGDEGSAVLDQIITVGTKSLVVIGKTIQLCAVKTFRAAKRAVTAGFSSQPEDEEDSVNEGEEPSLVVKLIRKCWKTTRRMVVAALSSDDETDVGSDSDEGTDVSGEGDEESDSTIAGETNTIDTKNEKEQLKASQTQRQDFGSYLSKAYDVDDNRENISMLGGSLQDALKIARAQARLLVVFIPGKGPSSKANADNAAIESILSGEVSKIANKKARKKGETGSFLFWAAKPGSSDAVSAIKRLKAVPRGTKGEKRPVLLVAYPSQKTQPVGAIHKIFPRMLAQHHCTPPPSSEDMAAWLNALRKRHAKHYAAMQKQLKELEHLKERQEGYKKSVDADVKRREEEAREALQREQEELREKQRQEKIEQRRQELKDALPEDASGPDVKTVALRFWDGRVDKRSFSPETELSVLFNWVDALHEIERETVVLTTMNGKHVYQWDEDDNTDMTRSLKDIKGFAKNTGLRVAIKKEEEPKEEEPKKEDSE